MSVDDHHEDGPGLDPTDPTDNRTDEAGETEGLEEADSRSWPTSWLASSPGAVCPRCGEAAGRPNVMGMPSPDLMASAGSEELDVHLGGCCIDPDDPTHICSACGGGFIDTDALDPGETGYVTGPNRLTWPYPEDQAATRS